MNTLQVRYSTLRDGFTLFGVLFYIQVLTFVQQGIPQQNLLPQQFLPAGVHALRHRIDRLVLRPDAEFQTVHRDARRGVFCRVHCL
ncbi:hypothetical protein D3C76_1003390 [compost metagenome]